MNIERYGEYEKYKFGSDTLRVSVITLGATVESLKYKGRETVLRYDDAQGYENGKSYICATVGRFANRIGGSRFTLNGKEYILPANEGENQLHGGKGAYNSRAWAAEVLADNSVRFSLNSPDGDNGFPGNLTASVTYTVLGDTLRLDFGGVSDADTVYAPTSHMYFALGEGSSLDYDMRLSASGHLEVDAGLIPTGRTLPCEGDFDFDASRRVARNFDDAFVLNNTHACTLSNGGISLDILTDFPALQVYTAISMSAPHSNNCGIALEPEEYPDSPNKPHFPSVVLRAGEEYHRYAEYKFSDV